MRKLFAFASTLIAEDDKENAQAVKYIDKLRADLSVFILDELIELIAIFLGKNNKNEFEYFTTETFPWCEPVVASQYQENNERGRSVKGFQTTSQSCALSQSTSTFFHFPRASDLPALELFTFSNSATICSVNSNAPAIRAKL